MLNRASRILSLPALVLALTTAASIPAAAFGEARLLAREALAACGADMARHCADVPPGGGRIAVCLAEHRQDLSAECSDFLDAAEIARAALFACAADAEDLCPTVAPGGGRVVACLTAQRSKVSRECNKALDAAKDEFAR